MALPESYALKGRVLFPIEGPPIRDGYVTIDGTVIRSVGNVAPSGATFDLGNVAILPGLVNAHVHLEFSDLAQPLGEPGEGIAEWIPRVLACRWDSERPPLADRIASGVRESLRHGTTTLGEIATDPWSSSAEISSEADLVAFFELLGRDPVRVANGWAAERQHWDAAVSDDRWHAGLSPHAPYTVTRALLDEALQIANARSIPLAMHLAESREELAYLATRDGPLADLMASHGVGSAEFTSVTEVVQSLSTASRSLIIHGNYLDSSSIAIAARHADRMAVIYCPRTHAFFGHDTYPLARLLAAGVNVALGTDGRSSNPDLSLLAEMRHASRQHPDVSSAAILKMGTLCGAVALGRDASIGSLRPGKDANLAVVPLPPETDEPDAHGWLLDSDFLTAATIYRGRIATTSHAWPHT